MENDSSQDSVAWPWVIGLLASAIGVAFLIHLSQSLPVAALVVLAMAGWYFLGSSLSGHVTEYDRAKEEADHQLAEVQERLETGVRQLRAHNEAASHVARQAALEEMDARIAALQAEAGHINLQVGLFELKMLRSRPARDVLPLADLDRAIESLKGMRQRFL